MKVCIYFCGFLHLWFGLIVGIVGDIKKLGWMGSILYVLNERM